MSRRNRLVVATAVAGAAGLAGATFFAPPAFAMTPESALSRLVRLNRASELSNVRSVEEYLDRAVQITATALAGQFPPPGRIAAVGIGLLGWYSRAEIVDLLGLVDPVIARSTPTDGGPMHFPGHQRGNAERVLSLAPDYILVPQTTSGTDLPAVNELLNHPSLKEKYEWDPVVSGFRKRLPLNLAELRDRWERRRHALARDRHRSRRR